MKQTNKICKECGKEVSSGSIYCGTCGNDKFEDIIVSKTPIQKTSFLKNMMIGVGVLTLVSLLIAMYMLGKSNGHSDSIAKTELNSSTTEYNISAIETNSTKVDILDTNNTVIEEQSQVNDCDGYTFDELQTAKSKCGIRCMQGCTNSEYKSCFRNILYEECQKTKSKESNSFNNSQYGSQPNTQAEEITNNETTNDMEPNSMMKGAYRLITGNELTNNNDIVEKYNSKNVVIYCLADGSVCKTETEVAKYLNLPTGGSIKKLFGHWVYYENGNCKDDEEMGYLVIGKDNNLIYYSKYESSGVVTKYTELNNGSFEIDISYSFHENEYADYSVVVTKNGKTLNVQSNYSGKISNSKYKYCGDAK